MRVLVVDDAARVRTSLQRGLTVEGFQVETAADANTAWETIRSDPPEALVLDVLLPDIDGLELCARLREAGHDLPVLILTVQDQVEDRVAGFEVGADDYLGKPFALEELVMRLHALIRRAGVGRGGQVLRYADLTVDTATRMVRRGRREIDLTPTEYDLLLFLMSRPGWVLTKAQILEEVWGYPTDTSTNTLEVFVGYLRRKLEEGGEPRLVHTVRGVGYSLRAS